MIGFFVNIFRATRQRFSDDIRRFDRRFAQPIKSVSLVLNVVTFISAVAFLTCFIVYVGFNHSQAELDRLMWGVRVAQVAFLFNIIFNILFNGGATFKGAKVLNRIVNIVVLLTLVPVFWPSMHHHWLSFVYSRSYLFSALTLYSLLDISYGVMSALSRRTNPSLILSGSFVIFIVTGAFMLMLPKCSYFGISFPDAFFLATSAVCITGLTPIDISLSLTPFGLLVLSMLIQIGALGVMTFTSFFALFFSGNSSIYSQLLLSDIIYSRSMNALIPTLLYVLGVTLFIEALGAVMIFISIHDTLAMTLEQEIIFSLFHSLSAFCNAGFSTISSGLSNPTLLHGNTSIYWIMSILIMAGAIGFPILANIREVTITYLRRLGRWLSGRPRSVDALVHIYSVNTKIVCATTFPLLLIGAIVFFILEYDNTLAGMTLWERITQSVFNSVTPRSAGFSSVNPASFLNSTLLIVMMLMWIGGASQSTAGGIKVNTFAAILLNLRSIVWGRDKVIAFNRAISLGSIRRANAVVALSILSYALYSLTILLLEPHLPTRDLLFETLSALFTVGSSLGVTASLSAVSKFVLCSAMFLGRVGMLSFIAGLAGRRHSRTASYPTDNLIIS